MVRNKFNDFLRNAGNRLFSGLSACEERGILPRVSRWFKLTALGALAVAITAFCKKADTEPMVMCYRVAPEPDVRISELAITPNPTNGVNTVQVEATAKIVLPGLDSNFVTGAQLWIAGDTLPHNMESADGAFDDTAEVLVTELSLEGLPAGTSWVSINATTSLGGWGSGGSMLVVTDEEESH